jgi:hypothetical protein
MRRQPGVCIDGQSSRAPKFPLHSTFVSAVQHLRDYGTLSPINQDRGR